MNKSDVHNFAVRPRDLLIVRFGLPLERRGKGGGGSSRPKIREEAGLQKIFSALRASVWSKTMGGKGRPLLDPPLKPMCDPPRDFRG